MTMRAFVCLWALSTTTTAAGAADPRIEVATEQQQVPRHGQIEWTLRGEIVCGNPYDPDEADVRMELVAPSGRRVSVPAFYYQPYETRPLSRGGNSSEWLYPSGPAVWKVRFSPAETGAYTGSVVVRDRAGAGRSAEVRFECVTSRDPGGIRVCPQDRRYLAFEDGTPFFAVGQNVAFVHNSYRAIEKIRNLGSNGGNWARVWACAEDWAMAVEARKSAWGRSWSWDPPLVPMPDREGYHANRLCAQIRGDAATKISVSPSHPVGLRPSTKYRLTGRIRSERSAGVAFDLNGPRTLAGKREWTKFVEEFTAGPDQWWLPSLDLKLAAGGTAWLCDLSLREAAGGPDLLWEADPDRPVLGVYNQPDCFMLDRVVEAAEASGVYLQLTLLTRDHYMRLLADERSPEYEQATRFARRLLRYCVARWGYSTHVAAWEYFNEMNPGLPTDRFYDALGQTLEEIDYRRRLRANSTWSSPSKDYRHPRLDTADMHFYLRPANGESWKDEVASILARRQMLRDNVQDARPVLMSEFGVTDDNWQRSPHLDQDAGYIHLRHGLWASMLSGFAGTVCHWYWDDIQARNLYHLYRPVAAFARDVPWTSGKLRPATASAGNLRVVGLQSDAAAYLWIQDPQATWWNIAVEHRKPETRQGAGLQVEGLPAGDYRLAWWDTATGEIVREAKARAEGGRLTATVPDFAGDIACQVLVP